MEIMTTRFGPIRAQAQDRVEFPLGLVGLRHLKRFVAVRDPQTPNLRWLQSTRDPAWALALVAPRAVLADYQIRATADELASIQVEDRRDVDIYVILNRSAGVLTANMQAPVLINRRRALGMQLVLSDAHYQVRQLINLGASLKKSA